MIPNSRVTLLMLHMLRSVYLPWKLTQTYTLAYECTDGECHPVILYSMILTHVDAIPQDLKMR